MKTGRTRGLAAALSAAFILFATVASADMSWTQTDTVTDDDGTQSFEQTISLSGGKFAIESGDSSYRMVIDIEKGLITTIDMNAKSYTVSTLEKLEAMRSRIENETDAIIKQALKNIPDDQKEMYRKELEKQLAEVNNKPEEPEPSDYTSTGESAAIGSWTAQQYRAESKDGTRYDVWCAKEIDTKELRTFFEKAGNSRLMQDISSGLETLVLGFPVKSVVARTDGTTESVVTSVSHKTLPQDVFSVPDGFTERKAESQR